jgi:transposase
MGRKRKVDLVLKFGGDFSESERKKIIKDYLKSGKSKREIWEKYTGQKDEHGQILKWMRNFGIDNSIPVRKNNFVDKHRSMKNNTNTDHHSDIFENIQLKKRIEQLEKQLKDAEMKSIAYSTMIDIAEKELNISIRKKSNTKPSKK